MKHLPIRSRKVGREIHYSLAGVLSRSDELGLPGGMISVSRVEVSSDLGHAKVALELFESSSSTEQYCRLLNSREARISRLVAENIRLKRMPKLRFIPAGF